LFFPLKQAPADNHGAVTIGSLRVFRAGKSAHALGDRNKTIYSSVSGMISFARRLE
jgi:hypothetical protein